MMMFQKIYDNVKTTMERGSCLFAGHYKNMRISKNKINAKTWFNLPYDVTLCHPQAIFFRNWPYSQKKLLLKRIRIILINAKI